MYRALSAAVLLSLLYFSPAWAGDAVDEVLSVDAKGSADSPLTGRYEGSFIVGQSKKAFDEITLPSGASEGASYDDNKKFTATVTAQGKVTRTALHFTEGPVFTGGRGQSHRCAQGQGF